MGTRPHLSFCTYKTAWLAPELLVSIGSSPDLWFCAFINACLASELLTAMVPAFICGFWLQNSNFWTRTTSLYGCQASPVVLCLQNNVISTRITSLYRSQPSSVVFAYKTATFGPELQVFMGTRPHLSFCACKRASLAPEKLVSMWPSPHLWFLDAKQRLLDQKYLSLCDPALICGFWMQNSDFWTRISSLYGSKTSSAVLCKKYIVIFTRMRSLYFFFPFFSPGKIFLKRIRMR